MDHIRLTSTGVMIQFPPGFDVTKLRHENGSMHVYFMGDIHQLGALFQQAAADVAAFAKLFE
jgi:hypothetical protein